MRLREQRTLSLHTQLHRNRGITYEVAIAVQRTLSQFTHAPMFFTLLLAAAVVIPVVTSTRKEILLPLSTCSPSSNDACDTRATVIITTTGLSHQVNTTFTTACANAAGLVLPTLTVPLGTFQLTLIPSVSQITQISSHAALQCNRLDSLCIDSTKLKCAAGTPELSIFVTAQRIAVSASYKVNGPIHFSGTCQMTFNASESLVMHGDIINGHLLPRYEDISADVDSLSAITCDGVSGSFISNAAALFPNHVKRCLKTLVEKQTRDALDSWASTAKAINDMIPLGHSKLLSFDASAVGSLGCLRDEGGKSVGILLSLNGGVVLQDGLPAVGAVNQPPLSSLPVASSFDAAILLSDSSLSSGGYAAYRSGRLQSPFPPALIPGWTDDLNATALADLIGASGLPPAWAGKAIALTIGVYMPPVITSTSSGILVRLPISLDARLKQGRPKPLLLRVSCQPSLLIMPRSEPRQGCGPLDNGAAPSAPLRIAFKMAVVEGCHAELISNIGRVQNEKQIKDSFEGVVDLVLLPALVVAVDGHHGIMMNHNDMVKSINTVMKQGVWGITTNFTECASGT